MFLLCKNTPGKEEITAGQRLVINLEKPTDVVVKQTVAGKPLIRHQPNSAISTTQIAR